MASKFKVLIDTDSGLDDAGAIFMVLEAHKRGLLEVVALTTVHGNSTLRNVNRNTLRILQTVNMLHIPVYSGSEYPMNLPYHIKSEPFFGVDGFGNTFLPYPSLEDYIKPESAILKIIELIKLYKKDLAILAIGPLTNIALVKMIDNDILSNLHSLHIMGGTYLGQGNDSCCAEFNFGIDPEAAQQILSDKRYSREKTPLATSIPDDYSDLKDLSLCKIYITPWETCITGTSITLEERRKLGSVDTPQAKLLYQELKRLEDRKACSYISCDQLSAAWMMDMLLGGASAFAPTEGGDQEAFPSLSSAVLEYNVTVETMGLQTRGQMVVDRLNFIDYAVPATILTEFDKKLYLRYLGMAYGREF